MSSIFWPVPLKGLFREFVVQSKQSNLTSEPWAWKIVMFWKKWCLVMNKLIVIQSYLNCVDMENFYLFVIVHLSLTTKNYVNKWTLAWLWKTVTKTYIRFCFLNNNITTCLASWKQNYFITSRYGFPSIFIYSSGRISKVYLEVDKRRILQLVYSMHIHYWST